MQHWQPTVLPACLEMQIVCRASLGINTASPEAGLFFFFVFSVFLVVKSCFSPSPSKYRTDPSIDEYLCRTIGNVSVVSEASLSRNAAGRFVTRDKSKIRSAYSARYNWSPR